jgi:hypothetical protein
VAGSFSCLGKINSDSNNNRGKERKREKNRQSNNINEVYKAKQAGGGQGVEFTNFGQRKTITVTNKVDLNSVSGTT